MSVRVVRVYCPECKHAAPDEAVTSDDVMIPVASCLRCHCLRFERIYGDRLAHDLTRPGVVGGWWP